VKQLNKDPNIHGIIIRLPLNSTDSIDSTLIIDSVATSKDVEGLNTENQGKLSLQDWSSGYLPSIALACLELIKL
jgi:5,10-methylene-tetrahydrofolate dehydrogenase/methenyl tetrahydrofolate cyclohydrolase